MGSKKRRSPNRQLDHHTSAAILSDCINTVRSINDSYRDEYLHNELLSKFVGRDTADAKLRRERAIRKWLDTEQRNRRTNMRLFTEESYFNFGTFRISSDKILIKASQFITELIGEGPDDLLWSKGSFSSGASTSKARRDADPAMKYESQADVTHTARTYLYPYLQEVKIEHKWALNVVDGNVLFTVPKSTDIDRVACKEPDLNMFFQKSVGSFFRRKLRQKGIDLNDQMKNQSLAREGSIHGELATIDLSAASDSVTTQLCARLLPVSWFVTLMELRSPITFIDDVPHENEMMSSMGNGFTFELESLIFWSLLRSVAYFSRTKGTISVYGDDLIIPSDMAKLVISVFGFCGFKVNTKKSHTTGFFRESCGAHWYKGTCVKPFYIRRDINRLTDLIHLLNQVRSWYSVSGVVDPRIEPFWLKWSQLVPKKYWGGTDILSVGSLVSPHGGGRELKFIPNRVSRRGIGGKLYWFRQTDDRRSIGDTQLSSLDIILYEIEIAERKLYEESIDTSSTHKDGEWSNRHHRKQWTSIPMFPSELLDIASSPVMGGTSS